MNSFNTPIYRVELPYMKGEINKILPKITALGYELHMSNDCETSLLVTNYRGMDNPISSNTIIYRSTYDIRETSPAIRLIEGDIDTFLMLIGIKNTTEIQIGDIVVFTLVTAYAYSNFWIEDIPLISRVDDIKEDVLIFSGLNYWILTFQNDYKSHSTTNCNNKKHNFRKATSKQVLKYLEYKNMCIKNGLVPTKEEEFENNTIIIPAQLLREGYIVMTPGQKDFIKDKIDPFTGKVDKEDFISFYRNCNICSNWKQLLEKQYPFLKGGLYKTDFHSSKISQETSMMGNEYASILAKLITIRKGWLVDNGYPHDWKYGYDKKAWGIYKGIDYSPRLTMQNKLFTFPTVEMANKFIETFKEELFKLDLFL